MLDLDLDLEADLGVDTVKQAEMFAAIREIYNIPRDENRKLRDYPTWRTSSGSCTRSGPTWRARLRCTSDRLSNPAVSAAHRRPTHQHSHRRLSDAQHGDR